MSRYKKWMAAGLVGLAGGLLLTMSGCGNSKDDKELTVWLEKVFSDDANTAIEDRIQQFGQEKGITVDVEFISATDFVTKLNTAVEAGRNVPDVVTASTTKIVNYYPANPTWK
ncbi:MAG: extracellular solute-binding protein [Blautia sp.]